MQCSIVFDAALLMQTTAFCKDMNFSFSTGKQ